MKTIETKALTTQAELREAKHVPGLQFLCAQCGATKAVQTNGGTGYGYNAKNEPICYACCGENDKQHMRDNPKICLYLTTKPDLGGSYGNAEIGNWPGSLKLTGRYHKGGHNMAGSRYDVWFSFEGTKWHGVQYGDNTQICHCRKLKA